MKNSLLLFVCLSFSFLGFAQTEEVASNKRYAVVGINLASLVANQIQIDAEFGREQTTFSLMANVFYGQVGSYENSRGEVFSSSENFGAGLGVRIYETTYGNSRFFVQPSVYFKSLAITHGVMQFIPTTYDGLPAQRWGRAYETEEYRGFGAELLAGTQAYIGRFAVEGGIGFVYRDLNPLQQTQRIYDAGAELVLGKGQFSPLAMFKLGYKF